MSRLITLLLTGIAILYSLVPIIWLILSSFKSTAEILLHADRFISEKPIYSNFYNVLFNTAFFEGFINSIIIALACAFLSVLLALFMSYLCVRVKFNGSVLIEQFAVSAYVIPPVLFALPLFILFNNIGLVNSLFSVFIAHLAFLFPLAFWLIMARMKELSSSTEEVIIVDGGDILDVFHYSLLPVLRGTLLSVCVIIFTASMNDYVFARFMLLGNKGTLPIILQGIFDMPVKDWGLICASGTLAIFLISIPIIILTLMTGRSYDGGARG